jgi:8-oxo-dGTP pyrophosphatase MutT (NUDIX family)
MGYVGSYLWSLRQKIGSELVLMPGAQVVLADDRGRCLFQRRLDSGLWEFPSGACEPGSSFTTTAVEELNEETGYSVDPADLVAFGTLSEPGVHVVEYPNGDLVHCFALCFVARKWSGAPVIEVEEVTEAGFFPWENPPQPLQPATGVILDMYREFLATGVFQAR